MESHRQFLMFILSQHESTVFVGVRKAEVYYFEGLVEVQQQILGFQVAMHNP